MKDFEEFILMEKENTENDRQAMLNLRKVKWFIQELAQTS